MAVLAFCGPASAGGQELLDSWIVPLCARYGLDLAVAPPNADRLWGVQHRRDAVVVWDLSDEGAENVYRTLTMHAKTEPNHVLLSRTPLPRNVLGFAQCAPVHGHTAGNDLLGGWLDRLLHSRSTGGPVPPRPAPEIAAHYWHAPQLDDLFLSFRGSHQGEVEAWRTAFMRTTGRSVRMVPPNEYAYRTEIVTQQQLWEGAARLKYEIEAIGRAVVYPTDDYFASFWTATELLILLFLHGRDPRTGARFMREAFFARPPSVSELESFRDGLLRLGVPMMGPGDMDRFVYLTNNASPVTTAPETRVPARGLGKLIALAVRNRYGYYQPEFQTDEFWQLVRVPCPRCAPQRDWSQADWREHMRLPADRDRTDYFGYFPADPADLARGSLTCPNCGNRLHVANHRGTRSVWQPVQSTEADQDRPVLWRLPVWEVLR